MKQNSGFDLSNAYFQIFYYSIKKKEKHIIILEDDFDFDYELNTTPSIIKDIEDFFHKKEFDCFMYNLGPFPQFSFPFYDLSFKHYKAIYATNTQSLIYSNNMKYDILKNFITLNNPELISYDGFIIKYYANYFYRYPLCYQTFPQTENSGLWDNILLRTIFRISGIDKNPKPGFPILFYICVSISYIFFIAFFLLILFLFVYTFSIIFLKKNEVKLLKRSRNK
jgi:hypothetical protein